MDRSSAEPYRPRPTSAGSQNTRDSGGCRSPYERDVSVWLPRRKRDLPPPRAPSFKSELSYLSLFPSLQTSSTAVCSGRPPNCERQQTRTYTHHYNNSSGGAASLLSVTWSGSAPLVVLATIKTLTRMR